jgi:hypothetical protein
LHERVLGTPGSTADTASPRFWMRLRGAWDVQQALERERPKASERLLIDR